MSKPRSWKARGRKWEDQIGGLVAEHLGVEYGITEEFPVSRARASGSGCDILLHKYLKERFPFWIECKDHKTLAIPAWIKQVQEAQEKADDSRTPLIVFKVKNDRTEYAVIGFKQLLALVRRIYDGVLLQDGRRAVHEGGPKGGRVNRLRSGERPSARASVPRNAGWKIRYRP